MFSFGGSSSKWWNSFADNFRGKGGEGGRFFTGMAKNLSQTRDYLRTQGGGELGKLLHSPTTTSSDALKNMDRSTMGWSRQLSPLWEGGLTASGGTTQDIFGTEDQGGLLATWLNKAGHHTFGQKRAGYGSSGSSGSSGGNSSAVVSTDTEDPSLINQGNWQNAATIDSYMRRVNQQFNAGIETDLAATQRGRLKAANIS